MIEALGLKYGASNFKWTISEENPLFKDEDFLQLYGQFSYIIVAAMLMYLACHTCPYISYAVNCYARYMFGPRHYHELAFKIVGLYLKSTRDKLLVLNPSYSHSKIECLPGSGFAGIDGHENTTDPLCVKSGTGFFITFVNCPVLFQ